MSPTINGGDHFLVDLTEVNRRRDGIYILRLDGSGIVKRLSVDTMRKVAVVSTDNPGYEAPEPALLNDPRIIGRVIWIGRSI